MQSLVDDDMVHQDKIGISNFFWYDVKHFNYGHAISDLDTLRTPRTSVHCCRSFPSESAVKVCSMLRHVPVQSANKLSLPVRHVSYAWVCSLTLSCKKLNLKQSLTARSNSLCSRRYKSQLQEKRTVYAAQAQLHSHPHTHSCAETKLS